MSEVLKNATWSEFLHVQDLAFKGHQVSVASVNSVFLVQFNFAKSSPSTTFCREAKDMKNGGGLYISQLSIYFLFINALELEQLNF